MRYEVTQSFFLYAETQDEAIKIAKEKARLEDDQSDNMCTIDTIRECDFENPERKIVYKKP